MASGHAHSGDSHPAQLILLAITSGVAKKPYDNYRKKQKDKAMSAAMYRRTTKVFQDGLAAAGPGLRILTLRGASAAEGGVPIVVDGRIVGGIGVSGGSGEQDGSVAKAGLDALAK